MATFGPWSDLPPELISTIVAKLRSNSIDMLSFRTVCKSWQSSSSLPMKLFHLLPLIIPSLPYVVRYKNTFKHDIYHSTCLLSVTVVLALRSPTPRHSCCCSTSSEVFVLFLDQSTPGKVSFRRPFDQRKCLLPITFPRRIDDVPSFNALELGRFYNLAYPCGRLDFSEGYEVRNWSEVVRNKVVLFSSANDGGKLFVVVLYEKGELGLLRLLVNNNDQNNENVNNNDQNNENVAYVGEMTKWEIIHYGKGFRFDDIVNFKGRVLGVDRRGRVYTIDIGSSSSSTMINDIVPAISGGGGRRKRLVESLGRLHLVVRTNPHDRTNALFKVYQLCEDTKKWVEVSSLGDQTFLIGLDFSVSASAEQLHGSCGKNWILYKQKSFLNYDGKDDDEELFRSLAYDQLHIAVWSLEDGAHLSVIGSHPGYASVFWPPPTWFWQSTQIDQSECLEALLAELGIFRRTIHEVRLAELHSSQKESIAVLKKHSLSIKNLLNRVRLIEFLLEETERIDVPLHQHCNSENLHNQASTSTPETKHQCLSTDSLQRAITQFLDSLRRSVQTFNRSGFGWVLLESNVNECIVLFEQTLVFFERILLRERTQ